MPGYVSRSSQANQGNAVLFDTQYGAQHNGAAVTAGVEFAFLANITFTVLRPGSLVIVYTDGGGQVQSTTPGMVTARGYLDSAGANTLYYMGGQRVMVNNEFANPFTGHGGSPIANPSVGAHTWKINLFCEVGGACYQRANGYESFRLWIVEYFNRGFIL